MSLVCSTALAQRIPCATVLHEMNRLRSARSPYANDADHLARRIGTSPLWVEKCASTYGRRVRMDPIDSDERVRREERWESEEATEIAREELATQGDELTPAKRERDRARQRSMNQRKQDWETVEHKPWEIDDGREWSPFLYDHQREPVVKIPGLSQ